MLSQLITVKQSRTDDDSGDSGCCVFQLIWCQLTRRKAIKRVCCWMQGIGLSVSQMYNHVHCALFSVTCHDNQRIVLLMHVLEACLGGAVGSVAVRAAWLRWSASLSSRPRLVRLLCQVIAAYALRLNSRAGTEGSTVSSLICDHWLILGLETLSISRCLNHW